MRRRKVGTRKQMVEPFDSVGTYDYHRSYLEGVGRVNIAGTDKEMGDS